MRAFLAVRPPEAVLDALARIESDPIWPSHRRTPRDRMHVTVAFFGRVEDPDALIPVLAGAVREVAGSSPGPGPIRFRGLGAFPSARRAHVCWAGVDDGRYLSSLRSAVTGRVAGLVEHRPERPYRPHLTLARFRRPADIRPELRVMRSEAIGAGWSPSEVALFESETRSDGARYRPVARFVLGAGLRA